MTEDEPDSEGRWKEWKKLERIDRQLRRLMFILFVISIYPISKLYDALSLGLVQKFSTRGPSKIYSLSESATAYYYNTGKWCIWAALCLIGAIGIWWHRRNGIADAILAIEEARKEKGRRPLPEDAPSCSAD